MTTLEAILAELRRQAKEPFGCYLSDDDPTGITVDGSVDLVALAAAVDKARADEQHELNRKIDVIFASVVTETVLCNGNVVIKKLHPLVVVDESVCEASADDAGDKGD